MGVTNGPRENEARKERVVIESKAIVCAIIAKSEGDVATYNDESLSTRIDLSKSERVGGKVQTCIRHVVRLSLAVIYNKINQEGRHF